MFHADGNFPSPRVYKLPLTSSAATYYTSGRPFLQRYLPFWLAILVMQVLVAALPLIGVVYPALKFMPTAYQWAMRRRIYRLYGELRVLEGQLAQSIIDGSGEALGTRLDDMERKVRRIKVPLTFSPLVYALRLHINVVRTRIAAANSVM